MYEGVGALKALILKLNDAQQVALLDSIFASSRDETADVDLSGPVNRIVWVLLGISTIVVSTRLVIKLRTTRRLYLDDGLMAVGLVSHTPCLLPAPCINRNSSYLVGFMLPFYRSHSTMASDVTFTIWSLIRDILLSSMASSLWSGAISVLSLVVYLSVHFFFVSPKPIPKPRNGLSGLLLFFRSSSMYWHLSFS